MAERPQMGGCLPKVLELEPGEYWWCVCGRSKDQPWCDGSHAGTGFEPMQMNVDEKKRLAMCTCKFTDKKPLCDGTHSKMKQEWEEQNK